MAREALGETRARKLVEHAQAVRLQAGLDAFPEGRRSAQGEEMRQEIGDLVQNVDAQVVLFDTDMHVHAADQQPLGHDLQVLLEDAVTQLVGSLLFAPLGERMRRSGDRSVPVRASDFRHGAPQVRERRACLRHRGADFRADLDLGPQELGTEPPFQALFERLDQGSGGFADQVLGAEFDQQILLFDADRKAGFGDWHQRPASYSPDSVNTVARASPRIRAWRSTPASSRIKSSRTSTRALAMPRDPA